MRKYLGMGALLVGLLLGNAQARAAISINLGSGNFFADPTVTVAPDGLSAQIAESSSLGEVLLSNDPGLGDPVLISGGPGISLVFDYEFVEGPSGNDDEFEAFILDAATGDPAGLAFQLFTQVSAAGTATFDLSSLAGKTLGLQFQLSSAPGDNGLASLVNISNVQLLGASPSAVPEPSLGSAILSLWGLFGAAALVKRRWRHAG